MRIEKPNWPGSEWLGGMSERFNAWFDKEVEPINGLLSEGGEVYGENDGCWFDDGAQDERINTHKALLINIQPIKKDTANTLLKDLVQGFFNANTLEDESALLKDIALRARDVLDD